ncbi:PAS domain S-box-containing protein [Archangium gephyra]|uniref:histidine kinase n=1 Tax=Archangium gephyra TaxID=48 RepID=A0AAC8TCZ1_9BACT|nr:ATP-binding protein [Archangium gephyra]AKJ01395.1 Sensory box histidine kinase [Archangium gephyra]REG34210.1 PAS domain S-box-containing protein [Archangium gephyra]
MWGTHRESQPPPALASRPDGTGAVAEETACPLLLVGEQVEDLAGLEELLAPLEHPVHKAVPWSEDLGELLDASPACLIVDARRSWTVGIETARRLLAHPGARYIPVLFLGGHSCGEADLLRGYAVGTVDCILEPLSPDILRLKVGMYLEQHRRQALMREALERAGQAEAAARESERMLRTLLGNVPGMVYRSTTEEPWALSYASQATLVLSGYTPEDFTQRRVTWGELIHPEDAPRVREEMQEALATRSPFTLTYRIRTRTGEERWVWERGVALLGPDEEARALEGFIFDITPFRQAQQERERLHEQLEFEHQRLQSILQQLPVAVHIAEAPSGRTLNFNAQAESILGHPMLPCTCVKDYSQYHAIHPDGRRLAAEEYPIARVLATGKPHPQQELLYDRPDGSVRVLLINAGPIFDARGRLQTVVASFMDITALKRAETHHTFLASVSETLASSLDYEATLAHVVQRAVPDLGDGCALDMVEPDGSLRRLAVAHVDPVRREISQELARHCPPRLEDTTGPGAVIRTGRTELVAEVTEELLVRYASDARHLELLRGTGVTSSLIVPLHARDRTFGALAFFYCRGGQPRASRHYGREEQRLAEDLARRAALAVDNARLYREAQRAVRLRDEFLSVASHELKTPLTPLNLNLSALSREVSRSCSGAGHPEALQRHVDMARRQLWKLSTLLNALFDVSRIAQGRLTLEVTDTDLGEVLGEVAAWFSPEAARVGSKLWVEGEPHVPGRWDRLRLEQVVTNLLSNAIRYGAGRPIHARVEARGDRARLVIRDEGIGISPEALERIFGKFERAVSDRHYGGLGLGLYITRSIVEAMGGTIRVDSRPGQGSTFTVELPRRQE